MHRNEATFARSPNRAKQPRQRKRTRHQALQRALDAFDRAEGDRSVGAILFTAIGPDFCAGMDLREQLDANEVQLEGNHQRLPGTIQRIHKPIADWGSTADHPLALTTNEELTNHGLSPTASSE